MKKFFAFVVAMAMTVVANAGLVTFVENGQKIIAKSGDVVTLHITSDVVLLSVDVNATLTGGDAAWDSVVYSSKADSSFSVTPEMNGNVAKIGFGNFNTMAAGEMGTVSVLYKGGEVVVDLVGVDTNGGSIMGDFVSIADVAGSVTIVPEPMTMSLLALGGLVAARRRNA